MVEFVCIGVPYIVGEASPAGNAIEAVQASGIAAEIGAKWVTVEPDYVTSPDPITAVNRALIAAIQAHPNKFPLIFTGDCANCIGVSKAFEAQSPTIIWLDAHGDFNTPETSPSNFLGGMPLAALVGRGNQHWLTGVGLAPRAEGDIIISDVRDLDPQEGVNLRTSGIKIVDDVRGLLELPLPDKPLYIHFDTDVVRLEDMPAMSYPAAGGVTLDDMNAVFQRIIRDGQVICMLFTLWNNALPNSALNLANTLKVIRVIAAELRA